jgi:hypothetical protein
VYDLLVKRISAVRFLFGMGPRKKALAAPTMRAQKKAA